jgi:hypothetical protein
MFPALLAVITIGGFKPLFVGFSALFINLIPSAISYVGSEISSDTVPTENQRTNNQFVPSIVIRNNNLNKSISCNILSSEEKKSYNLLIESYGTYEKLRIHSISNRA